MSRPNLIEAYEARRWPVVKLLSSQYHVPAAAVGDQRRDRRAWSVVVR